VEQFKFDEAEALQDVLASSREEAAPASSDPSSMAAPSPSKNPKPSRTTLMIRNIPNKYT
jgi:hypothetical protein